jgi:anti-anti-sigma factor
MNSDVIEVGVQDRTLLVRVRGRGIFLNCQPLKQYALGLVGRDCRTVLVEAGECTYMDSSFLGMLTGLAIALRRVGGAVEIANPQPKVNETMRAIGLYHVFTVQAPSIVSAIPTERLTPAYLDKLELAKEILEAHGHLIEADQGNRERFRMVREELHKELGRQPNDEG